MQRAFDLIVERLNYLLNHFGEHCDEYGSDENGNCRARSCCDCVLKHAIEIVNEVASEYGGGWIPVEERLPEVETEVLIHARRKYTGGYFKDIITTAMYEDGTVREDDSCWRWEDVDGEWDEERDCLIIPEGWWENKHYNPDGELNYAVDDKVIEWMPLPEPSKFKFECANPSSPELIKELNEKLRKI